MALYSPLIYICNYLICLCIAMSCNHIVHYSGDKVILEYSLDYLVEEIRCQEFMNVSQRKVGSKWLSETWDSWCKQIKEQLTMISPTMPYPSQRPWRSSASASHNVTVWTCVLGTAVASPSRSVENAMHLWEKSQCIKQQDAMAYLGHQPKTMHANSDCFG